MNECLGEASEPTDSDDVCGSVLMFTVPEGAAGRLDAWLSAQAAGLSRARLQALIKLGFVTCGGMAVKANDKLKIGQVFEVIVPPPEPAEPLPEEMPLCIVHEDSDLLVLDKPPGLVVHPAPGHAAGTLVNALLWHCRDLSGVGGVERPGIVHRLDKDTSGLMVVAKNDAAMAGLVRLFQSGGIVKEYLALVHGAPPKISGTVQSLIGRHPSNRKKMAVVHRNGKQAVTHYRVECSLRQVSLVRCRIETGRTHQIRVHMLSLGCPIAGDALYGRTSADKLLPVVPCRQMLHAARLAFKHPLSGADMSFEAPLPVDFKTVLDDCY
ncbi:MAG: RluA family pseudouridine synthase [Kiritimatiellae bacterium]|nr:RluA family pseudouridine synthase [Kiritimatiellia bacterium]